MWTVLSFSWYTDPAEVAPHYIRGTTKNWGRLHNLWTHREGVPLKLYLISSKYKASPLPQSRNVKTNLSPFFSFVFSTEVNSQIIFMWTWIPSHNRILIESQSHLCRGLGIWFRESRENITVGRSNESIIFSDHPLCAANQGIEVLELTPSFNVFQVLIKMADSHRNCHNKLRLAMF